MMSLFKFSLSVIITCCAVCIEVPAISAQARKEEESIMWETKFNSLQASQLLLQTFVLKLVSGQDNENERRIALESNLAHETEKRTLLEASQLQLKNSLSQETRKRTLLEDLFHSLQNGLSYEKQRRTELEDQVASLKAVLKDQHETLQKAVENVTLLCCVPSSHKMKACKACRPGFSRVGNACYSVPKMKANWLDAQALCMAQGAYLADILSLAEENVVVGLANTIPGLTRVWVGASKNVTVTGTWRWTCTGKSFVPYINFRRGQPDGDGNCLNLMKGWGYKWNDENCNRADVNFVCKYYE